MNPPLHAKIGWSLMSTMKLAKKCCPTCLTVMSVIVKINRLIKHLPTTITDKTQALTRH